MSVFYKDEPVFGFDIGRSSIKVMQIEHGPEKFRVAGYGTQTFNPEAIDKGVIIDQETIIKKAYELLTDQLIGTVTTDRVAVALPNAHSFNRVITLPLMEEKDLAAAVQLDAEQSIPVPINDLYWDFEQTRILDDGNQEVQLVACPRDIVDSYLDVFRALNLKVSLVESNISAVTRIVVNSEAHEGITLIVDFGSSACDLSIYDGKTIRVTGSVDCSGENITKSISESLGISMQQAHSLKTRYGLEVSKKQAKIVSAVEPELTKLINEIKKVIRYFTDRAGKSIQINQIIVLGGGANLPGLSGYITDKTRIATRLCYPWGNVDFGKLQPPHELESTLYTTAAGLSLITPKELSK